MSISQTYQGGPPQPVAPPPPPVPMDLKTTRGADGSMTTTTPGAPSGGFGDPSALFQALIKHRLQNPAQQPVAPVAVQPQPTRGTGALIERMPEMSRQTRPASQAPIKPKVMTREVIDPQANPYHELQTGFKPRTVRERLLPNGKWEFEDLRPQGGSGGIQGGGMQGGLGPGPAPRDGVMPSQRETSMTDAELDSRRRPNPMRPNNYTGMGGRG